MGKQQEKNKDDKKTKKDETSEVKKKKSKRLKIPVIPVKFPVILTCHGMGTTETLLIIATE